MLAKHNKMRPRHERLRVLRTTNKLFAKLLNYRYYRLNDSGQSRSAKEIGRVRSFADKLGFVPKDRRFDGTDGILIFDLLRSLI